MTYLYSVIAFILLVIVVSIPMVWIDARRKRRVLADVFDGRQELDERQFFERYFEARGIPFFVVAKVRGILEEELDADFSRLQAGDDFSKNLGYFFESDSLAAESIIERLSEEFDIVFVNADFEPEMPTSVAGIVDLVWAKTEAKAKSDA